MWDIKQNVQNLFCKYTTNRNSEGESEFSTGQGTSFAGVVKNILSLIICESQFMGYFHSEKDNSKSVRPRWTYTYVNIMCNILIYNT
jgi:hypothetical protein